MKELSYFIYIHINKTNLKVYVGQTCQQPQRRWRNGKSYATNQNTHFANAIRKWGWDNFEHIILEEGLTKSQADFYESMYIREYDATNGAKGYNQTSGGANAIPNDETRKKMSENHADFKGEKSPMYGKNIKDYMSDEDYQEWLRKIRKYASEHRRGKNASAQMVYCFEKDRIYDCVTDAAEDCNVEVSAVSSCINGYRKSAGFDKELNLYLHWCKLDDIDTFIPAAQNESKQCGEFHWNSHKIYCVELDESFYGVGEVQRKYGINSSHISDCLHGKRSSCGKHPKTGEELHWCYYDEKDSYVPPCPSISKKLGKYHPMAKAVYCVELNEMFDTAVEANKKYGFSKQHIGSVCRGQRNVCGKHPETGEGLHWLFVPDAIKMGYIE